MPSSPIVPQRAITATTSLNGISSRRCSSALLMLWCCCYCLLLLLCANDAAPLQSSAGTVSGEQFERADRDYRPLQFGKRESYRPLQFGKRTVASRGLLFAPAVAPPAFMHNLLHNGGLEEMDPTMDQYFLMVEKRRK
uniref:Uncharacterized protein n=1 Tax=Globodera rostochiensis TaxID=31243 RepID=A0A914H7E6_GLORO